MSVLASNPPTQSTSKIPLARRGTLTNNTPVSVKRPPPPAKTNSITSQVTTKDTSSSNGTVYAKPSKEWVLPERAKPGRKKRQSQNRLSQRAHRARKTDYISTLEERLRQYEADEIHSNVRLQEVARALKADNERLKKETHTLRAALDAQNSSQENWLNEKLMLQGIINALREEVDTLRSGIDSGRMSNTVDLPRIEPLSLSIQNHVVSPNVERGTPREIRREILTCPICPDPDPDCPCQQPTTTTNTSSGVLFGSRTSTSPPSLLSNHSHSNTESPPQIGTPCGFCRSPEDCLCVDVQEIETKPNIDTECDICNALGGCVCAPEETTQSVHHHITHATQKQTPQSQIHHVTDSTPVLSAEMDRNGAMKLRLKTRNGPKTTVWALEPVVVKEAVCTGDPSNCEACKNDSFGREFCSHLFQATSSIQPCPTCPGNCMSIESLLNSHSSSPSTSAPRRSSRRFPNSGRRSSNTIFSSPHSNSNWNTPKPSRSNQGRTHMSSPRSDSDTYPSDAPSQLLCCGDPALCGTHGSKCSAMPMPPTPMTNALERDTMRCDEAWKTLKAHPNASSANLALLADVVAGRMKCLGPETQPTSIESNSSLLDPTLPSIETTNLGSHSSINLIPHVSSSTKVESAFVNHDIGSHSNCNEKVIIAPKAKKRRVEVELSAVREALKILDRTPTPGVPTLNVEEKGESSMAVDGRPGSVGIENGGVKRRKIGDISRWADTWSEDHYHREFLSVTAYMVNQAGR
ncbi:hypothetical protein TREMEDRAFT_59662 [Tremella mesenterica DSM 1558]|uniref:uncharacterized protein n=1 Tax=Tremella mesenterica (strain ATCC 24925 / CBS 8224 / DSM 1558 / NBRC 9311 / NRRL Y-6157 / RJB 2259-6 / UBC 559-6) TaxID=578456 RepID=UPI0003F495C7|nr:uncharacterized protein TREMEDRAFT_59662 [Tremella mesenterica DSM 1558]EIW73488.1 hypothetical protein TREMEDRAFT_59662 [Tremella mesenterica DSM 1558]